jgi:phospholipid transport system substrate-binding protein
MGTGGVDNSGETMRLSPLLKLLFLPLWLALSMVCAQAAPSQAAESFVGHDINAGLAILKNPALNVAQRNSQFETFLLGITDLKRIALYTLGTATATPQQQDAFVAAFQNYAVAIYRTYFALYSGQTLNVTGSDARTPDDVIVHTSMAMTGGAQPLKLDFRVRLDGGKPVIIDLGVTGVWLAVSQHADFEGFLAQHHGDVTALTAHLGQVTAAYSQK